MSEARVPCEVYSRIVGYLRPVANWNDGKKAEFADRKTFAVGQPRPAPARPEASA